MRITRKLKLWLFILFSTLPLTPRERKLSGLAILAMLQRPYPTTMELVRYVLQVVEPCRVDFPI